MYVVPEPSERWATVMSVDGSLTPGLRPAIAESFHFVTLPRMMLARRLPENFNWASTPGML